MSVARCPTCGTKFDVSLVVLEEEGPDVDTVLRSISRAFAPKKKSGKKRGRPPKEKQPEPQEEIV